MFRDAAFILPMLSDEQVHGGSAEHDCYPSGCRDGEGTCAERGSSAETAEGAPGVATVALAVSAADG